MNLNKFFDVSWFAKVVFVIWLTSSLFVVVLLSQIDGIVHGKLYDYGLNFSYDWAVPYWSSLRLIYVCLGFPAFLTVGFLVLSFWDYLRGGRVVVRQVKREEAETVKVSEDASRGAVLFSCNSCGKRFSKPILMLDFSGGKTRLVNVCPFCGAKLGENNEAEEEFEVRFGEEEVVREKE